MIIGINGLFYSKQYTGIGQYTVNLVHGLSRLVTGMHRFVVFLNSDCDRDNLPEVPNVEFRIVSKKNYANDVIDNAIFEYLVKKKALELKVDILHSPYLCSSLLHGCSFKHVVTVHDVIPMIFTAYRGSYLRHLFMTYIERRTKKADLIITDSRHSQKDINKYLGIAQNSIKVVSIAADAVFQEKINENETQKIKAEYSLPDNYIFYIGGFDFRKNVKVLLEAYATARKKGIREMLVLGGKFSPSGKLLAKGVVENVPAIAGELGIQDHVRILGPIPQKDLPHIYRLAKLFVYPSLYEGFGLPPLEAMCCGTPVLASNSSSIPEIIDRDDLLFDPNDSKTLSEKMFLLLTDDEHRHSIGEWGIKKAKTFSWSRTAKQTFELYKLVCSESNRNKQIDKILL